MSRAEFLRAASVLHAAWSDRIAEQVPTDASDQKPDGPTDYPEHHHDVSATAAQQDRYHAALARLLADYQASPSV